MRKQGTQNCSLTRYFQGKELNNDSKAMCIILRMKMEEKVEKTGLSEMEGFP